MAKIYFRRIMAGEMTLDEVPTRWREAVRILLEEEYARREAEEQAKNPPAEPEPEEPAETIIEDENTTQGISGEE